MSPWWLRPAADDAPEDEQQARPEGKRPRSGHRKPEDPRSKAGRPGDQRGAAGTAAPSQDGRSGKDPAAAGSRKPAERLKAAGGDQSRSRSGGRRRRGKAPGAERAKPQADGADGQATSEAAAPAVSQAAPDERRIALFCDLENLALGLRESESQKLEIRLVMERLLEKGKVVVRRAYADWERHREFKRSFHEMGVELIDVPQKFHSGKNCVEVKMAVDAMEFCFSKQHLDTFVILSGEANFAPLVTKLQENDKHVLGIGAKEKSSGLLVDSCDEFLFYEDLWHERRAPAHLQGVDAAGSEEFALMIEAIQALRRENREVLWGSMIKQMMRRKNPSFSEGSYGYSAFSELLEEAERRELVTLRKDERSGSYIVTGLTRQLE